MQFLRFFAGSFSSLVTFLENFFSMNLFVPAKYHILNLVLMYNLVLEDLWENMANFIILSWHLNILDLWFYPPYLLKLIDAGATTIMAAITGDAAV